MSQHIEWAEGLGDWTVNPGEWVDGYGSRNTGPAIWSGSGDGVIIEFASIEDAVTQLRALADQIEAATDTSTYSVCRYCGREIVFVPESMGDEPDVWVHVEDLGAEVTQACEAGGFKHISPAHQYSEAGLCQVCGEDQEDDAGAAPCVPLREE